MLCSAEITIDTVLGILLLSCAYLPDNYLSNPKTVHAVTEAEIELATALNVPLLGASPAVVAAVQAKAGARALFQRARMNVSPGLCVQPVEGDFQVLGDLEAHQTLEGLTTGYTGSKAEPPATMQEGKSSMGRKGTMKLSFTLQRGDLVVKEHPDRPRKSSVHERKDRSLCDHIAKAMLISSAKATQVRVAPHLNGCHTVLSPKILGLK